MVSDFVPEPFLNWQLPCLAGILKDILVGICKIIVNVSPVIKIWSKNKKEQPQYFYFRCVKVLHKAGATAGDLWEHTKIRWSK